MGVKQTLMHGGAKVILEWPGRRKSLDDWADDLSLRGLLVDERARLAKDPEAAQRILQHITGIERWGQRRLRVFLGEPEIMDEYNGYRPGTNLSTEEQRTFFRTTRLETVDLARQLAQAAIDPEARVPHNDFGPLTPRGWLRYLDMHANSEIKKVKL